MRIDHLLPEVHGCDVGRLVGNFLLETLYGVKRLGKLSHSGIRDEHVVSK